jgi:hypothetical protein
MIAYYQALVKRFYGALRRASDDPRRREVAGGLKRSCLACQGVVDPVLVYPPKTLAPERIVTDFVTDLNPYTWKMF